MNETKCPHCTKARCCDSESGNNYHCTREQGHSGPHVACGAAEHDLATWPNSESIFASGIDTEVQSAATSNGPGPKAVPTRVPDAQFNSSVLRYSESFADRIVNLAKKKEWLAYVNLCEQAAHIGRVALLESQADEMGVVTQ